MGMINVNATQNRTQNFSRNFTITGNGAEDTVNVAQAQLGKPVHSLVIQNNGVRIY